MDRPCPTGNFLYLTQTEIGLTANRCCLLKTHLVDLDTLDILKEANNIPDKLEFHNKPQCDKKCNFRDEVYGICLNIIGFCNLRCYNCCAGHNDTTTRLRYKKNLRQNKALLFNILDKCKALNLNTLILDGSGEIFLYYSDVIKWLKTLDSSHLQQVSFLTNGTCLSKERLETLKDISNDTGINYKFNLSVDGITKETFEATRVGATFEKVIETMINIRDIFGNSNIKVDYTLKATNKPHDIKEIKAFFDKYNISHVKFHSDFYDDSISLPEEDSWDKESDF